MRKIEENLRNAWLAEREYRDDNSVISKDDISGELRLYLFGNLIARKTKNNEVFVTLAGWRTKTTNSRLWNVVGANYKLMVDKNAFYKLNVDGSLVKTETYGIRQGSIIEASLT